METKKKKVLVIDDQEEIRELVDITLSGTEFEVHKAFDGREGVLKAKELKPDLILMDIMMPEFDGFMTSKIIKRNPLTKDIPVIYLTAKKSKEDIQTAIKSGGVDYIIKPFSPNDLLTRIRKMVGSKEIQQAREEKKEKVDSSIIETTEDEQKKKLQQFLPQNFKQYDDVIVCSNFISTIVIENCYIYRGMFSNFVSDGNFKVVLDTSNINKIDGAGLGLLISVNESLRSYGGELRLTYPNKEVNNKFSFININDLINVYNSVQEAVDSFKQPKIQEENVSDYGDFNICMSCTFVNDPDARYCKFCGTNLMVTKGEKILEILERSISQKIIDEAQTKNVKNINKIRNINVEESEIPSEFNVEILDDTLAISYKSCQTYCQDFKINKRIAIEAPYLRDTMLPVQNGMKLQLTVGQSSLYSVFETEIVAVDRETGMIYIPYTEEAKVIHSQKNFSIAPGLPIPVSIISPSFNYTGKIMKGKILEMSRVRLTVFTEDRIPRDVCLAVSFNLPDGDDISSPLVMANKRKDKFMYDLELVLIDERERSRIIQYMYRRQIETARMESP